MSEQQSHSFRAGSSIKECAAIIVVFLATLHPCNLFGQATVDFSYKTFNLERDEENEIQNASHLDDVFEKMLQLRLTGKGKLNIVHIGDSHIQADYLTDIVRRNFQRDFGNAGRGLIVPARVAGTNEPPNFRTSSNMPWRAKRIVYPDQPLPVGIGGITVTTDQPGASITLKMAENGTDNYFNAMTLFFQKDITSFHFSIRDTSTREVAFMGPYTEEPFVNYSRIVLPRMVNQVVIQTMKSTEEQNQATIFGINLENNRDGVIYHAIGVNGAKYTHYNAARYFAKQTQALQPDVFVISLGTNESLEFPYMDKSFTQHIDKLIQSLREYNPQAKFILVTPQDAFRRKVRINPGVEIIRNKIIEYAVENGLAFWDMYKTAGGKHAAPAWRKVGLLRPDGVHFSKEGYEYQGNLFYKAMLKSYNNYVPLRNP